MKVDKTANKFILNPVRVALIRRIFKLHNDGLGQYAIAKMLNNEGVPAPRSKHWSSSSIAAIIRNRAVIGEYQPHIRNGKTKREPVGEPIKDYYPPIITEMLFEKAQDVRASRNHRRAGRKNKNYNNLFAGMIHCGYCGGRLNIDTNKYRAHRVHTHQYQFYINNAHGHHCTSKRIRYVPFELAFMHHITEVNFRQIFDESDDNLIEQLETDCFEKKKQLNTVEVSIENLLTIVTDGQSFGAAQKMLVNKLNVFAEQKLILEKELRLLQSELSAQNNRYIAPDKLHESLVEFFDRLKGLAADELADQIAI